MYYALPLVLLNLTIPLAGQFRRFDIQYLFFNCAITYLFFSIAVYLGFFSSHRNFIFDSELNTHFSYFLASEIGWSTVMLAFAALLWSVLTVMVYIQKLRSRINYPRATIILFWLLNFATTTFCCIWSYILSSPMGRQYELEARYLELANGLVDPLGLMIILLSLSLLILFAMSFRKQA